MKKTVVLLFVLFIAQVALAEVKVWEEPLMIPTWKIGAPEVNPTFSWSSSRMPVYPYPYKEIITNIKGDSVYQACWLENEFIKVLILPEIGGRLHGAQDKTNQYNFFYWQPTIKPALIGMTGAWISGGIEWNFPTGHRPTCFSPVSYRLEENADGSKTVWVGETEWIYHMRWIVGMTVYPDRNVIEAKVRLYNPTPLRHSYWMWTTMAVNANENYQAIYPTRIMTEHGKFEYFHWPVNNNVDISWWKNVPNASSFFATEMGDFFGGYDHGKQAGTIITGNRHIVIGKKLWTWGTSPFGRMWEPVLTEGQGPYFEPQAGAYSDNQPDLHWIEPGEVKSYSHFFFPVRDIGPFKQANVNGALNLEFSVDRIILGVYSTAVLSPGTVLLTKDGQTVFEKTLDIDPAKPFTFRIENDNSKAELERYTIRLLDDNGNELITYTPQKLEELPLPEPAKVYDEPENMKTTDELWHAGDIVYKFREPQRARTYFEEALRLDPGDSRSHVSLAELDIKRAGYESALQHLSAAEMRDPDNGKIFYLKAVAREALGDFESAYNLYYRSVHFAEYLPQGYSRIARLDLRKGDLKNALTHIGKAVEQNNLNPQLWALKATILRLAGDYANAEKAAAQAQQLDPLDPRAMYEVLCLRKSQAGPVKTDIKEFTRLMSYDPNSYIELACQYAGEGLFDSALDILETGRSNTQTPFALNTYYSAYYAAQKGDSQNSKKLYELAGQQPPEYIFPSRAEAINVFRRALDMDSHDGRAWYYLGLVHANLAEPDSAVSCWQKAVSYDDKNALAWRDLGLALYKSGSDIKRSLECYENAFRLAPDDSRILMELDNVKQSTGETISNRLNFLQKHVKVVETRDNLLTTMLDLMVQNGEYNSALEYYLGHHFHNWEGGYSIHNAYMEACIGKSRTAKTPQEALDWYLKACDYPENLEVAPRQPNLRGFLYVPMAKLYQQLNNNKEASRLLNIAAEENSSLPTLSNFYQALALKELGFSDKAEEIISALYEEGRQISEGKLQGYERRDRDFVYALGEFYMAKAHEYRGETEKTKDLLTKARTLDPLVERDALIFAQVSFAGAHQ
ncbi:DUF5107 domain-containing protein [candidate division KSB1 bacterium]|nr:DUF5107 domain-containing protein [candidate division KSB1 bacterium]